MFEIYIKIIGIILVGSGSLLFGGNINYRSISRIKEMEAIKKSILLLEGEIMYAVSSLPEAFTNIALRCDNEAVSILWKKISVALSDSSDSVKLIWNNCIDEQSGNLHLSEKDLNELKLLGTSLGYLDIKMQLNAIDLYVAKLSNALDAATFESTSKLKVVRMLSIAAAAFICIILI